ncbi:MAG: sugar ABC transporter ATP-binding protein [Planctomycetota bacterium]|jgi:ABC-type sugar transport system ATPase subunit|nr:sugar ABC transporter ATP-binding protein [Planctomycetota bacterium]
MDDQPIFQCKGVSKAFFGIKALDNVDIDLRCGRALGLIGENGAGKSTLMNVIGGFFPPDAGVMLLDGKPYQPESALDATRAGIGFIHQELNLFPNLTIAENIFIDDFPRRGPLINRKSMAERTTRVLRTLGMDFSPWLKVERLMPGERQMVEIARVLASDARIIIFDEPTTSLTAKETEKLFVLMEQLKTKGGTIVYISHILGDVEKLCDDLVVLRDGRITASGLCGDFSVERMVSNMIGRDIGSIYPPKKNIPGDGVALAVRNLSQSGIVNDISLELREGEVLGVFGLMGSGRTELMRMIFGVDDYESGEVVVGGAAVKRSNPRDAIDKGMAFITENRRDEGLLQSFPIVDNIDLVYLRDFVHPVTRLVNKKKVAGESARIAGELRIKCASVDRQAVKSLSGGNQQKVVLGKWLVKKPRALIMDEPTRGIDVGAKYEVYNIINDLAAGGSGVMVVSSELGELMGIADRIIAMSRGEIIQAFERGEFDEEAIMRAAFRVHGDSMRMGSAK